MDFMPLPQLTSNETCRAWTSLLSIRLLYLSGAANDECQYADRREMVPSSSVELHVGNGSSSQTPRIFVAVLVVALPIR